MFKSTLKVIILSLTIILIGSSIYGQDRSETIGVWLFDEQYGLYPSSVLHDVGPNEYVMVLGRGGKIVDGKFGRALKVIDPEPLDIPQGDFSDRFGLNDMGKPDGQSMEPMTWYNASFPALITNGERHLRNQVGFSSPTKTDLNIGNFDWSVEFWLNTHEQSKNEGVIFEIGTGPRGNNSITRLSLNPEQSAFILYNQPANLSLQIPTVQGSAQKGWAHYAFVYNASENQVKHYVNGRAQSQADQANLQKIPEGEEDYFVIGRDGLWGRSLPGSIDELRFSKGQVYTRDFNPPSSFKKEYLTVSPNHDLKTGLPLLFTGDKHDEPLVEIGSRKYLFIDDSIVDQQENITYKVNPPRIDRQVLEVEGSFRKHVTILEDLDGYIRLYTALADDYLGVFISEDGINFEAVDTGIEHKGHKNIVIPERVGTGTVFIDPNAPPETKYKYISDYNRRGLYIYTSPDGIDFTRHRQAVAPFRSGSQNDFFYDDQRQSYVGYHRSDYSRTPAGQTLRDFVMTEVKDLLEPWPFSPATKEKVKEAEKFKTLHEITPWYLDNGPLTPGGWGIEYPTIFAVDPEIDPLTMGVYNPKALKYPWAPDTYVAFPVWYFHYYEGPEGRQILSKRFGGGPTETQFAASRDAVNWKRYPRPVYSGIGRYDGLDITQTFIAQGLVKRGEELWQYVFLDSDYHSALDRSGERRVYRLVQRFDGFVSAEAPYEEYGEIVTRPLKFEGNRLVLNIDTDAHGYATVGLIDEDHNPIPGYSHDDAIYINGDFIEIDAQWLDKGNDLSSLQDQNIRVVIKMRGAKLYSMQFKK
ncbi:MAG: LamG-like jellyroll fold domain-containing protein [Balneolales bacterium]